MLNDFKLLAKLSDGDMIATEAHYHARCLVAYYNQAERTKCTASENSSYHNVQGLVLAELVAYIEDVRTNQATAPVFKLSELKKMYVTKLAAFGIESESRVNSTHLKDRILRYFPDRLTCWLFVKDVVMRHC